MAFQIRNTELCAYIDRECGDVENRRVVAALATSSQLIDRLALWRRNDAALRLALATLDGPAEGPAPLPQTIEVEATQTDARARRPLRADKPNFGAMAVAVIAGGSGFVALAFATLILVTR